MPGFFGKIGEFFTGKPDQYKQLPTKSSEQLGGLSQIFQNLNQMGGAGGNYQRAQDYLGSILSGDPNTMNNFAAPYLQNFEQQIVPRLAERFAGMGGGLGGGTMGSSGFAQALGGAGAGLQANLAGLFESLRQNAAQQSFGQYNQLANLGLGTSPFENVFEKGNTGLLGGLGGGLASGLGTGAGMAGGFGLFQKLMSALSSNDGADYTRPMQ